MYDHKFWNERYATTEYLYGTEANAFLVENAHLLRGPVLSLSEGEGRNAVFMASRGLHVLGVDCSEVGLQKARIPCRVSWVGDRNRGRRSRRVPAERTSFWFGGIHLCASTQRNPEKTLSAHRASARPDGIVLLEAYSDNQLKRNTGGPNIDMLMSVEKLRQDFPNLRPILAREIERDVREGEGHTGMASVVQFIAMNEA